MSSSAGTLSEAGSGRWRVRVEREHGGRRASGEVLVRRDSAPRADDPPHRALAAARAWLALGDDLLASGDAAGASASARGGLEELGDSYESPSEIDDTGLKLLAAEDRIEQGELTDGAASLLDVLRLRAELYAARHEDEIVG